MKMHNNLSQSLINSLIINLTHNLTNNLRYNLRNNIIYNRNDLIKPYLYLITLEIYKLLLKKIKLRYIQRNSIISNKIEIHNYNNHGIINNLNNKGNANLKDFIICNLYIVELICNIKLITFEKNNAQIISIYKGNNKLAEIFLKYNRLINFIGNSELIFTPINKKNKIYIILCIKYVDNYNIINAINIYNNGLIEHINFLIKRHYNYKGKQI